MLWSVFISSCIIILGYPSVPDFVHRWHGAVAGPVERPGVPPVSQPQPLDRGVVCAAGQAARHGAALVILGVDHARTENTLTHAAQPYF